MQTVEFPYFQDVSATFENSPTLCQGQGTDWSLSVLDSASNTIDSDSGSYIKVGTPADCLEGNSNTETLANVEFPAAGVYTIKATLDSIAGGGIDEEETDTVTYQSETIIVVDYPAAPAVAARLLNECGISNNYGKRQNHIADVAHFIGPGTDFDGASKSEVEDYEDAITEWFYDTKGVTLGC